MCMSLRPFAYLSILPQARGIFLPFFGVSLFAVFRCIDDKSGLGHTMFPSFVDRHKKKIKGPSMVAEQVGVQFRPIKEQSGAGQGD